MSSWWSPHLVATIGPGRNHEGHFLKHTMCKSGHKGGFSCAVVRAQVNQAIHMRKLNHVGVEYASPRAGGQTPDNEMKLNLSLKRISSGFKVLRVCWVIRHLSDLTYSTVSRPS